MDEQLIVAIEAKDLKRVEELLAAGANPNARKGDETAYQLVPHGAREIKYALIEAGADDPQLRHALVEVIGTGREETVRILISKGADVNVSTYAGTPIAVAARGGHTKIVELLIAAGADVDAGSGISTPLLAAIEHGYTDIALQLIAAGADPNRTSKYGGSQPISMAAAQGNPEIIRTLIAAGADVNAKVSQIVLNRLVIQQAAIADLQAAFGAMESLGQVMESLDGLANDAEVPRDRMAEVQHEIDRLESISAQQRTRSTESETAVDTFPVIITARSGHSEALAILLDSGADPHRKDGEGLSAYDWAVRNEYPDALAVLRQFGVTGTLVSADESLLLAVGIGDLDRVRVCLSQGADANARDTRRQTRDKTALILAAEAGHLTIVQTLLSAGADPNLTDLGIDAQPVLKSLLEHTDLETVLNMGYRFGRTALMSAAAAGYPEIIQELLQAGANSNDRDAVDYTALALAAENNHLTAVRVLVAGGAEVDRAVIDGNTPLMLACEKGALEVTEFLVGHGANVTAINRDRETPLMKASAVGLLPLVRLCLDRGADVNVISKGRNTALSMAAGASHYVEVDKNDRISGGSIREHRDDGSCWELQPLPEPQIIEVVRVMLQAGADPNIPNCETTPAIEAARQGLLDLLSVLLAAGADLAVRDRSGDTAASIAKLYGQKKI